MPHNAFGGRLIRILLDQGLPRTTATHFQDHQWDVLHTGDIGLGKAKDIDILEYARNNNRVSRKAAKTRRKAKNENE